MHDWEPVASNGFVAIFREAETVVPAGQRNICQA